MQSFKTLASSVVLGAVILGASGCATTPRDEADRTALVERAGSTKDWFQSNVNGLGGQLRDSGGYVVFPDVGQAGFIVGGTSGRGVVFDSRGRQIGWARLSSGSVGLQAGVRGFRMLMILQNEQAMSEFEQPLVRHRERRRRRGRSGRIRLAEFRNGVAVYRAPAAA